MKVSSTLLATAFFMIAPMALADDRLAGFAEVDISAWQPLVADHPLDLIEQLYDGHPEATEGRPELNISLRLDADYKFIIDIEMSGYLDDSVSGNNYRAIVDQAPGGWKLEALGLQNICYRGANAGVPTTALCP